MPLIEEFKEIKSKYKVKRKYIKTNEGASEKLYPLDIRLLNSNSFLYMNHFKSIFVEVVLTQAIHFFMSARHKFNQQDKQHLTPYELYMNLYELENCRWHEWDLGILLVIKEFKLKKNSNLKKSN